MPGISIEGCRVLQRHLLNTFAVPGILVPFMMPCVWPFSWAGEWLTWGGQQITLAHFIFSVDCSPFACPKKLLAVFTLNWLNSLSSCH